MKGAFLFSFFLLTTAWLSVETTLQAARDDIDRQESSDDSSATVSQKKTIGQLIEQLGDDQYLNRRRAELRLIEISADAFDQLQEAENHSDLEIAYRAHYILHRIRIDWIRPEDSEEVQIILHRYGDLLYEERLDRIDQLSALDAAQGLGALCRIARYEPSPILARKAALEVLQTGIGSEKKPNPIVAVLMSEVENSRRVPTEWIRLFIDHLGQREDLNEGWLPLIDAEIELLEQESEETDESLVRGLLRFHLELCAQHPQEERLAFGTLHRLVDMLVGQGGLPSESLAPAMIWVLENKRWKSLELVEARYTEQIHSSRFLVYLAAIARDKQGKEAQAEEFAEQAFQLEDGDAELRYRVSAVIGDMGRHDWAEREWQYLAETIPITEELSRDAREQLATLRLHDRGENEAAAELLAEYCDAVEADPVLKKAILANHIKRNGYQRVTSQRDFLLACHAEQQGDFSQQREYLDRALKYDPLNPDILIAMYHSKGADEAYRKKTLTQIHRSCKAMESNIEQDPDRAYLYNHWAWLVSNTEGDYAKAVQYSQHSLKLSPDSPSLLDTLGRCYYASGDLENAVKVQRQAVEGHPHLMVMHRQLELFERELVEQNKE